MVRVTGMVLARVSDAPDKAAFNKDQKQSQSEHGRSREVKGPIKRRVIAVFALLSLLLALLSSGRPTVQAVRAEINQAPASKISPDLLDEVRKAQAGTRVKVIVQPASAAATLSRSIRSCVVWARKSKNSCAISTCVWLICPQRLDESGRAQRGSLRLAGQSDQKLRARHFDERCGFSQQRRLAESRRARRHRDRRCRHRFGRGYESSLVCQRARPEPRDCQPGLYRRGTHG